MLGENSDARKKLEEYAKEKAIAFAKVLSDNSEQVNGINIATFNRDADPAMFREAASILQKEVKNFALAAAYEHEGKPQLLLMYSADLVAAGHNASADIREAAKFIQGGGGGQSFLATAGGRNTDGLKDALDKMVETITK
jgi:alanyl-tRNA synthetase